MGRRSRHRGAVALRPQTPAAPPAGRPVAPARRAPRDEAPPAPWGSFPLVELAVLAGLVAVGLGLAVFSGGAQRGLVAAGVAAASLAGLEVAVREHRAGYRSHTSVLALAAGMAVLVPLVVAGLRPALALAAGASAGVLAALALRSAFARRAGGLTFRT
jgi:hypothetical protein